VRELFCCSLYLVHSLSLFYLSLLLSLTISSFPSPPFFPLPSSPSSLLSLSTCGMEYQDAHYSGNFYWAHCDHIASLPRLHNRFDAWYVLCVCVFVRVLCVYVGTVFVRVLCVRTCASCEHDCCVYVCVLSPSLFPLLPFLHFTPHHLTYTIPFLPPLPNSIHRS
jgi:hypothetical protein